MTCSVLYQLRARCPQNLTVICTVTDDVHDWRVKFNFQWQLRLLACSPLTSSDTSDVLWVGCWSTIAVFFGLFWWQWTERTHWPPHEEHEHTEVCQPCSPHTSEQSRMRRHETLTDSRGKITRNPHHQNKLCYIWFVYNMEYSRYHRNTVMCRSEDVSVNRSVLYLKGEEKNRKWINKSKKYLGVVVHSSVKHTELWLIFSLILGFVLLTLAFEVTSH